MSMFLFSVFLSFLLSKITWIALSFKKGEIDNTDILASILIPFSKILNEWKVSEIQAFEFVNFGHGFEGTSHTLNFVCTYTIVFFITLLIIRR